MDAVLQVSDLNVKLKKAKHELFLVHGMTMSIGKKQIVGLVGESGSGKTMAALATARLLPSSITAEGRIMLDDYDILALKKKELNRIRTKDMSIIFQEPFRALNPLIPVGVQVEEVLKIHTSLPHRQRKERVLQLFEDIGLTNPSLRYYAYPHQLSGGINQRIMIAIAAILNPQLLIADEPTTALDVTVQKQILTLMKRLRDKNGTSILLITHDLALASEICDYIYVMYASQIVESGAIQTVFSEPQHPYTKALLQAIPRAEVKIDRLASIEGTMPKPAAEIKECLFYPRCSERTDVCTTHPVPLCRLSGNRCVRCLRRVEGR